MHPRPRWFRAGLCVLIWVALAIAAGAAESAKRTFNVPSGDAEFTLREFSKQAGVQIVFDVDMVSGMRTAVVQGVFEPREALNRMFAHTGFVAVQDEQTGALTIRRAPHPKAQRAVRLPVAGRPVTRTPRRILLNPQTS